MAKQLFISVTEDVIGEYVLNISKENIKIAAHRGKVKLESVQLDGDLIGSHVLGAAGLSGFGVLSCWAKTMTIFVPLKNLEKEPTRFELQGLHLVCVPLLPATAHKEYGAGTAVDPRCTLRTRAKRSALARYERNYFGGRIPGEGPPNRRIKVALKEAEQRLKKGQWRPATVQDVEASIESEGFMDDVVSELGDSFYTDSEDKSSKGEGVPEDLLSPQRTWKVKMREKVMRNLEVSMRDVHVRCEVAEQGLDFSQNVDKSRRRRSEKLPAEQRAFAFGVTVESAFVRTANDKWEVGSSRFVGDGSSSEQRTSVSSASGSSSTPRDVENRVMQVNNMAVYWDDDPPLLISETYVLRCNLHNLPPTKLQGRIAVAMEAMVQYQDPGLVIRKSLDKSEPGSPLRKSKSFSNISIECGSKLHDFCCHSFSGTVRGKLSGRNMPGPMQLFAEFMPLEVNLTFHPHQFLQYQKLRSAMLSQQRFDTMLRQRPKVEISDDPRLWWKYTIACVTTRPTSRPWEDVIQIVRSRSRYIELAKKKILNASEGNGFHAGLKESDSLELLALEDLLPIEALTAFHLLALREAFEWQKEKRTPVEKGKLKYQRTLLSGPSSIPKPRLNPFRRVLSAGRIRSSSVDSKNRAKDLLDSMPRDDNSILSSITRASLLQALQDRLGKKQWHVTFKLHNIKFIVSLVQDCRPIVRLELCTRGLVRTVGPDSREFAFDISQFEVFDCQNHAAGFTLTHSSPGSKILMFEGAGRNHSLFGDHVASQGAENEDKRVLALPPPGVVCRVSAASDFMSLTLGVSAHPATLVWNTLCIESIAEFFSTPSVELKTEVTRQLQNVATPLARKALLAFLSPSAIALNLNIAAPKLWFPISPRRSDGAVCLDAGKFRVECHKGMSKTDTKWNVDARDIQVMFVRPNKSSPTSENHGDSPISDAEEVSIIKPLHVRIDAELCEKQTSTTNTGGEYEFHRNRDNGMANDGPSRRIDITVSPICLNLVDAEVLARAIGKWYASGLVKAKKRVSTKSEPAKEHNKREFVDSDAENAATESLSKQKSSSDKYSLQIERIELALEGHSKPLVPPTREHSMLIDTEVREVYSTGPTTRTYLLELFGIDLRRSGQGGATKTILMVSDASIVKIQGDAAFSPSKPNHQRAEDPQNTILIREEKDIPRSNTFSDELHCLVPPSTPSTKISRIRVDHSFETPRLQLSPGNFADSFEKPSFATAVDTGILCVNLFHDKEQHLDEVEIDMDSVVIRVTPTSLKDCAKAVRRALELVQLVTREMERKVHEEGRKARQRDREGDISQQPRHSRPISPVPTDIGSEFGHAKPKFDSSILFKVTMHEITLLAGRPINSVKSDESPRTTTRTKSHAVVQVVSNALIMFQSVENADGSGSKTLHASFDNLSASMNNQFNRVLISEAPPMIGPAAAEFRIVYATENLGCVVSQDISLDCEAIKACLTPTDVFIMKCVVQTFTDRLSRSFAADYSLEKEDMKQSTATMQSQRSVIRYKKKGTGIATSIRVEVQYCSFVLLQAYRSKQGTQPLLDFSVKDLKGKFEGCVSALSGEYSAVVSFKHFSHELSEWEHAIEPFHISLTLDQMPNELIMRLGTLEKIQMNLTGDLLAGIADVDLSIFKINSTSREMEPRRDAKEDVEIEAAALATVGLRRALEANSVFLVNESGLDFVICPTSSMATSLEANLSQSNHMHVEAKQRVSLEACFPEGELDGNIDLLSTGPTLALKLSPSSAGEIGDREVLVDLPLFSSLGHSVSIHRLQPATHNTNGRNDFKAFLNRSSPETVISESSGLGQSDYAYYNVEPVVEWCMQNQRLRTSISDVFSVEKGSDLLSSTVWSPEDENNDEPDQCTLPDPENVKTSESSEIRDSDSGRQSSPVRRKSNVVLTSKSGSRSNWVRPYLKDDSPEWTDMTCILRMARERVMLPDNNWIWLNDWTVDLSGPFGESTDADGWEYEADFETFNRTRRFYQRGDACRRRRWTRTRMVRPPRLEDPYRSLSLAWETSRDVTGSFVVTVRSPLVFHNRTGVVLHFFVSSPSWEDINIGSVACGGKIHVPIQYSSATYLRLGTVDCDAVHTERLKRFNGCNVSRKVMILPTSFTSSVLIRAQIDLVKETGDFWVDDSQLHFLVNVSSVKGAIDIFVEPVMKIVNLLPCTLQCEFGEVARSSTTKGDHRNRIVIGKKGKKISSLGSITVPVGKEGKCITVNPTLKPHISLRVPGYHWSPWHRVVNRKATSKTWQSPDSEEEWQLQFDQGDVDYADEFKSLVLFERLVQGGDPLTLIVSVEVGHCPTIRIYSQYWILDKTGFGCRFCEKFDDLLSTAPDTETSRRSHLLESEAREARMQKDMSITGHQWSYGMNGMSMYFSEKERFALSIESVAGVVATDKKISSKWVSPLDISNVIPKTTFSVDESYGGSKRFDLAISVTVCPGFFARTKLITLFPRYQIVNLLNTELVVAQDGVLDAKTVIPPHSAVPYHWEKQSLAPKVRLAPPSYTSKREDIHWTNGCIQLDKIGITSLRFPVEDIHSSQPLVVQAEVRLATKEQSSAVTVVIWSTDVGQNPLYVLRNRTSRTILCRQPLQDDIGEVDEHGNLLPIEACGPSASSSTGGAFGNGCGVTIGNGWGIDMMPMINAFLGLDRIDEFVWTIGKGEVACFGFDDPEKTHILEWTYLSTTSRGFDSQQRKSFIEVDAMGTSSVLSMSDGTELRCTIRAEHSTKVIEFTELSGGGQRKAISIDAMKKLKRSGKHYETMLDFENNRSLSRKQVPEEVDEVAFSLRLDLPAIAISIIDNATPSIYGREIMLAQLHQLMFEFSQNREGYHELELTLSSLQVDNHVQKSIHPVMVFCPPSSEPNEPLLHMSAVRRLQLNSSSLVFRYAAIRLLEIEIFLDRRTVECIATFIQPLGRSRFIKNEDHNEWIRKVTAEMAKSFRGSSDQRATRDIQAVVQTANSGRIYFEQLHLHPIRLSLTFTQEWMEWKSGADGMMIFQFIRGMASIAGAPLKFTSFVVGHAFESPQALVRIIATHYSSQLTKQIFGIIGSLAILGAPADFISNVGTGVRDFFYEPINGMMHSPAQFIEGLEVGTQSLARGVFVGVVRGAANVTDVVNANLAGLTADDDFIDERKAHQRMLTDSMSRGETKRTMQDSLYLAGASVARGVKSGTVGMWEQPTMYASKHGPVGFVKGIGKALVGAIVKPVVGVGDAAVLVMNHVSDATSDKQVLPKIPMRLRRALPRFSAEKRFCVRLTPYDDKAAKAQKIVTGGESVNDVYIGHVNIPSHLIIASDQCLWSIDRRSREPWCVSWEEISHFGMQENDKMRITVFSQTGLKSYVFAVGNAVEFAQLYKLLAMQLEKMSNGASKASDLDSSLYSGGLEYLSRYSIRGIKAKQANHVFGSVNNTKKRLSSTIKDEIDVIEQCFARVKVLGSDSSTFFQTLDEEAWALVNSWGQVFSGLSSRRCIAASIINGTGYDIQLKATKLVEGGSPCYSIPSKEFDAEQGVLHPGGAIIFFGWGVVPNLLQAGNVFMNIETNAFVSDLSDHKSRDAYAEAMPGYQVGFLEKSYDESGWWAKYWLLVRKS